MSKDVASRKLEMIKRIAKEAGKVSDAPSDKNKPAGKPATTK